MARHAKRKEKGDAVTRNALTWSSLTWDNLDRWAGSRSVSRGRTYQRGGRVKDLVISADGRLLATVTGGRRYATSAWLGPGGSESDVLQSTCSCPVGSSGCKPAVAVVAAYLEILADDETVALADDADPRWAKVAGKAGESDDDDESPYDEEDDEDEEEEGQAMLDPPRRKRSPAESGGKKSRSQWDQRIEQHVRAKSRAELAELVCNLIKRFPELRTEFRERIALAEGDVDRLVAQARKELRNVTGEIAWQNSWNAEGHTPNYDPLKQRLVRLAEMGRRRAGTRAGPPRLRTNRPVARRRRDGDRVGRVSGGRL